MSDVTDADRGRAAETLRGIAVDPHAYAEASARIAAALAEERGKARAPFLALADDLEGRYLPFSSAQGQAYDIAAEIRRAAEETE